MHLYVNHSQSYRDFAVSFVDFDEQAAVSNCQNSEKKWFGKWIRHYAASVNNIGHDALPIPTKLTNSFCHAGVIPEYAIGNDFKLFEPSKFLTEPWLEHWKAFSFNYSQKNCP